jgi:hypothetical protein
MPNDDTLVSVTQADPCPFCGGRALPDQFKPEPPFEFRYICENKACEAWGPEKPTQEEAVATWNIRHPAETQEVVEVNVDVLGAIMVLENKEQNATACLAKPQWKPDRVHIEGMRNTMSEALDYLRDARKALARLAPTDGETK